MARFKLLAGTLLSMTIVGCSGALDGTFQTSSDLQGSKGGSEIGSSNTPPDAIDLPPGKHEVSCSNASAYNAELERVNALIRDCSFGAYDEDIQRPGPTIPLKTGSIGVYGKAEALLSYNSAELRTSDILNLFYGVNTRVSCNDWTGAWLNPALSNRLEVEVLESYDKTVHYGGAISFPGSPNYRYLVRVKKAGAECMTVERSSTGETVRISKGGVSIYETSTDTTHSAGLQWKSFPVRKEKIGPREWSLEESRDFSACEAKPRKLDILLHTQVSVGGTNTNFSNKPISAMVHVGSRISGNHPSHFIINTSPCNYYAEYNCTGLTAAQCRQ